MAEKERWDGWLGPKQWMPILGVLSVAVLALGVLLFLNMDDDDEPDGGTGPSRVPTHEHADFALFIRGQKFDFNKPEFLITLFDDVTDRRSLSRELDDYLAGYERNLNEPPSMRKKVAR